MYNVIMISTTLILISYLTHESQSQNYLLYNNTTNNKNIKLRTLSFQAFKTLIIIYAPSFIIFFNIFHDIDRNMTH